MLQNTKTTLDRYNPEKPLQVGGQAVIEGVMMRAPGRIATAVRRSNGEIVVKKKEYVSLAEKYKVFKLPILRGAVGLVEMMYIGIDTLNFSAEVAMNDLEAEKKVKGNGTAAKKKKQPSHLQLALTVLVALIIGIAIFFVTPLFLATNFFNAEQDALTFNLITGVIRISILLLYLIGISYMSDVKRLFEYHGAEHKAVFTFESQADLTVDDAKGFTRFHPRCGTSFILIVVVVAMLFFSLFDTLLIFFLGEINLPVRLLTHLPLIPLIGGIAYEVIRWTARRSTTTLGKILVSPGLWLQRVTTKEPDLAQLEVALIALRCALGKDVITEVIHVSHASELVEV